MSKIKCPYCGCATIISNFINDHGQLIRDKIHGHPYHVCVGYPSCDTYVACHEKSGKPMGALASCELRHLRYKVHQKFDELWIEGFMSRTMAYKLMQILLNVSRKRAHVSRLSPDQCMKMIHEMNRLQKLVLFVRAIVPFEVHVVKHERLVKIVHVDDHGFTSFYKYSLNEITKYLDEKDIPYRWEHFNLSLAS